MEDSELLYQAAEQHNLDIVASLVKAGARNDQAFLNHHSEHHSEHFYAHFYEEGKETARIFDLYETLLLVGHPIPLNNNSANIDHEMIIRLISSAPQKYFDRTNALLSLIVSSEVFSQQQTSLPLHIAIRSLVLAGNRKGIEILIPPETSEEQLRERLSNITGKASPLHTYYGNENYGECVKYLLKLMPEWEWEKLFQIHKGYGYIGNLVNIAASHGSTEFLNWVLKSNRANPIESCETNPITTALRYNKDHLVDVLFDLNCNPGQCGPGTIDPITQAIWGSKYGFIPKLIALGANVNHHYQIISMSTPLMEAVSMPPSTENIEAISLLLQAGAKYETADSEGNTALLVACIKDHLGAFLLLRQAGANFHHRNMEEKNALMIINEQHGAIKAFLEEEQLNQYTQPATGKNKALRI